MNKVESSIGNLQYELNNLVEQVDLYTDDIAEVYSLSQQLDDLIVEYYKNYKLV
ncbi:MAG: Spo0E family sporulation regulatory protein-aspartic acid phosphatase [Cellulosilyticaceae bacterium]